ncbi:MAG: helix-turn-helix transcriptional regulator [Candidatus Acidiferrum sp.]
MLIGDRLRELRLQKKFSQTDVEDRSGMQRAYISQVENNHKTPTVETLERFARALEIPVYRFFHEGEKPPEPPIHPRILAGERALLWGSAGNDARYLRKLRRPLAKLNDQDRLLILRLTRKFARR